jgi:hypothetical protein
VVIYQEQNQEPRVFQDPGKSLTDTILEMRRSDVIIEDECDMAVRDGKTRVSVSQGYYNQDRILSHLSWTRMTTTFIDV